MFAWKFSRLENFFSCKFKILLFSNETSNFQRIESFSNPDNLLSYPSAGVVLGTWVEHKLSGNFVQV